MQLSNSPKRFVLVILLTLGSISANAQENQQPIFPKGQRVPSANFTGNAWVHALIEPDSAFNIPVACVTFDPGARTHWHTHGGGQGILAIDGIGYYQEEGKPVQVIRKGETVKCPPNTPHWHGASPEAPFVQIAITPNHSRGRVKWMRPVTDAEYLGQKK